LDLSLARCPRAGEPGSAPPNRHPSALRQKTPEADPSRSPVWGRPVPPLERLALGAGHRQTRNGRGLASCRFSLVLDLEGALRPTGTTGHCPGASRPDSQNVPRESHLGCTPHTRELLKLGLDISESSVSKYMVRWRNPGSQTWRTCLENHLAQLVPIDFFTL